MSGTVFTLNAAGPVALVTIDNGEDHRKPTTLGRSAFESAVAVLDDLEQGDWSAAVFTGKPFVFCVGADIDEFEKTQSADDAREGVRAGHELFARIRALPFPTVAAINGAALGGGLELALACDFRILVEGAEVGLTEVKLGIMPGAGGTQRLPRLIGEARAKELILLGRRISAARALEIGLVHQVVPRAGLAAAVDALLAELATCAPLSVTCAKAAIERGYGVPIAEGLGIERECYDTTLFSHDRDEGLAAFAEGRPPRWLGR